jgi:hypothetical protein
VERGVHHVRIPGGTKLVEHPPKSDRGKRAVEIPASVCAMIERYLEAQDERRRAASEVWAEGWHADDVLMDDGIGRPMRPDTLSQRWRKLRARIGVRPEIRMHDFRALYVTESLAAGWMPASWPDRSVTLGQTSRGASTSVQGVRMHERRRMRSTARSAQRSRRRLLTRR